MLRKSPPYVDSDKVVNNDLFQQLIENVYN